MVALDKDYDINLHTVSSIEETLNFILLSVSFEFCLFATVQGALREIRKDNQFLAKQKLKEQLEK